eukprot:scaffold631739_cov14-Prasinocladus_malaysianus.AAC.1
MKALTIVGSRIASPLLVSRPSSSRSSCLHIRHQSQLTTNLNNTQRLQEANNTAQGEIVRCRHVR